jgi:hypothetical protein
MAGKDWEEVRRLMNDFQRVQQGSTAQRFVSCFSDRRQKCSEIHDLIQSFSTGKRTRIVHLSGQGTDQIYPFREFQNFIFDFV